MSFSSEISALAAEVLDACGARRWKIATAESCTGGLVAGALTTKAGSSDCFTHGFVTYANEAKVGVLGVNASELAKYGAVSEQVATQMAMGALTKSAANVAISVTGIAGPDGGSADKPVGLVHFAIAWRNEIDTEFHIAHHEYRFDDNGREAIRLDAVDTALTMILNIAQTGSTKG
jgi:nicotinamide-nucleotide amidase